jgi:MFS family permease
LNWAAPDWRALFWINLPVSLLALALVWWTLRAVPQERVKGRFDLLGTLLIVGALTCLVLGLGANIEISASATEFSDIGGLPPYAAPALGAALVMFVLFLVVELRVRYPLFDLRIFRRRSLSAGLATNLLVGFCLMIGLVSVPILVNIRVPDQSHLAEAALQVGILLSALTVPMAIAAVPGGWLSERIGYRWTAAAGLALALVGFAAVWQTWTLEIADGIIALEMALIGVGLGLTFSPISAAVINTADQDKLGAASALVIIMRLLGMTISVSLLTAFASHRLAVLLAANNPVQPLTDTQAVIDSVMRPTVQVLTEIGLLGAVICAVAIVPALLMRRERMAEAVDLTP